MNDVELFAACLRDLLLENDVVTVPGLGSFMARLMPASFSDLGRTINPPYRKLSFRAAETGDAALFTGKLEAALPEGTDADKWLESFVAGFKEALDRTKRVELASLGAMRATAQNDYFFVASEDIDIYPEGMGLEPVTIKSSTLMDYGLELKEDSDQDADAAEAAIDLETETAAEPVSEPDATEVEPEEISEPLVELVSEPEPEPAAEPKSAPDTERKPRRRMKWWGVLLIVLAVILLLVVLAVIFKDRLPWSEAIDNILNHILYSEEELQLLNS